MARDVLALIVLTDSDHVVIVGAGFGGWRLVEALRREGFVGAITLVGEETYAPYDRPPLSKQVLVGKWDVERATLATPEKIVATEVNLRLGVRAASLDIESNTVTLENGARVSGSHVVIATGARARRLPYSADAQIYTLRNRDDELRLRPLLSDEPGSSIAVIGGGFIGAEVATQLKTLKFTPTVFEALSRPLIGTLGPDVSSWLERLAVEFEIELRTSQRIRDVEVGGEGLTLLFDDGSTHPGFHAVIVGVGALPNYEWLEGSGLTLDNGVVVDANLLARENIAAIGDVARFSWPNVMGEELVRIEHWEVANMHANSLAHYWMTGDGPRELMVPYFWSDQYGKKIQMLGHPRPTDDVVRVSGSPEEGKWLALYSRGRVVTGLIALSQPRALMLSKHLLESPSTLELALHDAPWAS